MATSEQMRGNRNATGRRVAHPRQHISLSGERLSGIIASMQRHGDTDVVAAAWRLLDMAIQHENEFSADSQNS